jgi:hypothetical protein
MTVYLDSDMQHLSKLILCIEEIDNDRPRNSSIDTRVFILWNEITNDYQIICKRQDINSTNLVPYSFHAEKSSHLWDFMNFVIGRNDDDDQIVNLTLYNFNNLDNTSNEELTYEFFESQMDKNYEIGGYDKVKLIKSEFKLYVRLLRRMYNIPEY